MNSKKSLLASAICMASFMSGCGEDSSKNKTITQPVLSTRASSIITVDGLQFRDLNKNGVLDNYEDWRLDNATRINDLISQMTLEEKAGMMLIDSLNASSYGATTATHTDYVQNQHMTRFILRNPIKDEDDITDTERTNTNARSGPAITVLEAATYTNAIQEMADATRLGIPVLFKSNARNHIDPSATAGINVSSGAFSAWPKEGGLAATRDMDLIAEFGAIVRKEWNAIGLRGMYGYMADLSTEPRWYRVHETFTEDSDLASDIMTTLVGSLQGKEVTGDSIVLTMKHFPGGGPQFLGLDPHYIAGQHQSYPTDMTADYADGSLEYHYKPFKAAIDAGVAAIMPYYGIAGGGSWSLNNPDGETNLDAGGIELADLVDSSVKDTIRVPNNAYSTDVGTPAGNVGMAFSKGILNTLLRGKLGFTGVINSDTGIIGDANTGLPDTQNMQNNRAWGLQDKTQQEQFAIAIDAGTDLFSGFHQASAITSLVDENLVTEARLNESVARLLQVQFELGLFENPYVDEQAASQIVGAAEFKEKALQAQRKSIVMLQNKGSSGAKTLPLNSTTSPNLYVSGIDTDVVESYGFTVTSDISNADKAVIRVSVSNVNTGMLIFGGARFDEVQTLDFTGMEASDTWQISPSLAEIQNIMATVGADNTVLSIYFRQPFVLDESSGLKNAGAIIATFGVTDGPLMDILTGVQAPTGKLPFALANSAQAIIDQASDAPGYATADTLFEFGYGLSYDE